MTIDIHASIYQTKVYKGIREQKSKIRDFICLGK